MSGSGLSIGATIMSQVLVPMIFTSVPALMPAPTAPMWASKAPTATATPAGRPTFAATSAVSEPAFWSDVKAAGRVAIAEHRQAGIETGEELGAGQSPPGLVDTSPCARPHISRGGACRDRDCR